MTTTNATDIQAVHFEDQAVTQRLSEVEDLLAGIPPEVLGDRVRRVRARHKTSIREVAARAGISTTTLVRIEKGGRVRAQTILAVCNALKYHINRLVDPLSEDFTVAVAHRHCDARWRDLRDWGSGPLFGEDRPLSSEDRRRAAELTGAVPMCLLASRLPEGDVLPCLLEFYEPLMDRSHPGQEFVYVLAGRLLLTVGNKTFELDEGESLSFRSAERHSYAPAANTQLPARILSIRIER